MRSAIDSARMRGLPSKCSMTAARLAGSAFVVLLLVGCQLPLLDRATPRPAATYAPRIDPKPTVQIVSSDELYGEDIRAIGETSPSFASFPAGAVLPPVPSGDSARGVTVLLDASTSIGGELYLAEGLRQPGLLLLGEDLGAWRTMPIRLSESGYTALVLQTNSATQARQVETMLQSLIAVPGVDAGSIMVIGAGRAAGLAFLACAVNSLCDALALLSPLSHDAMLNMLPSYGPRPLWLAAGKNDVEASRTASDIARAAQGETRLAIVNEGRGAALLQFQPELEDNLFQWLQEQLDTQ